MPILGLESSSLNISSQGRIKYPKHELGLWDVSSSGAVPEDASWIVAHSADYGKPNLLENPGFELDFPGWWLLTPPSGKPMIMNLPSGYVSRSLRLTSNELGYQGGVYQDFFRVPPNTVFHFSAMIKTVDIEGLETAVLYRDVYDSEGNWYGGELKRIRRSADWTLYETSFTTPDRITKVSIFPVLVYNKGEVWIDETSLTIESWQPPKVPVILNWYTFRPSLPIRTEEALTSLERGLRSITIENFWGILGPTGAEEIYRTHIAFDDNVDVTWFGERLLGYPLYLQENPAATIDDWKDEMYLRIIRGFYNYFSPLTKVGITWGRMNLKDWNEYYGEPATTFIRQYYDFVFLYPYTANFKEFLQATKPYLSRVEELFPNQKKFWILTRIWNYNRSYWEREAIALEMKSCLDRNIVIMPYENNEPPLQDIWPLMLKAIELYDSETPYYEIYVYGRNLLTEYVGETYGWVEVLEK